MQLSGKHSLFEVSQSSQVQGSTLKLHTSPPATVAPHTSSPHLSPPGTSVKQPLYSPCTAQARTPQAWPSILSKVHDSRPRPPHSPNRTRPPQPRCLPKFPISSSSSRSAGARMLAVRLFQFQDRVCTKREGEAQWCARSIGHRAGDTMKEG
jgi:hypothetical protein